MQRAGLFWSTDMYLFVTNRDFSPCKMIKTPGSLSSGAVQVSSNQNMYLPRKNSWSSSVCGMLSVVGTPVVGFLFG